MTDDYAGGAATLAMGVVATIKPLLAGKDPGVQGAVLAELVATWLAGHRPDLRDEIRADWLKVVSILVPVCEAELFRSRSRPEGWGP